MKLFLKNLAKKLNRYYRFKKVLTQYITNLSKNNKKIKFHQILIHLYIKQYKKKKYIKKITYVIGKKIYKIKKSNLGIN